ncbi:LacI family gluconate utilization system Gnt-I transcriptional repressor [Agrobacterium vitis]|nr:LacI family gluconate utilization system Gnt-I transcriptional repressor [Agrobacterium vitis]MBE1439748.1 LacI family gluconate utilization system Gnt-I transcriptional repressor [Agrobacterium vitis]
MKEKRRGKAHKITLSDVAEKVGVSPITISRALNRPEKVTDELRETILEAVKELGYVPDFAARALASRTSNIIGVLSSMLSNSIFPPVMRGIEDRVRDSGMRIQYVNTSFDVEEEIHELKQFFAQNPAGVMIGGVRIDPKVSDLLRQAPCPVVQFVDISSPAIDMAIGVDNRAAGKVAIDHLLAKGYRRIGFCSGRVDIPVTMRLESYRQRLSEAGLYNPDLVISVSAENPISLGGEILDRLFAVAPDLDAILCAHDDLAIGVLFECQRRGIQIAKQLGICGFSDIDYSAHIVPSLTTVRMPLYQLGYSAANMILRVKEGRQHTEPVDLGFQLIERESTQRT